mmetsp:Transcript_2955/g.6354  ORF Transcript_2955/g.6354 Transcript_2955/m.6354 type:complete len:671 (-) Transcript_2955:1390-3402(-)
MRFPSTTAAAVAIVGLAIISFSSSASVVEANAAHHAADRHMKEPPRGLRTTTAISESIMNDAQLALARKLKAVAADTFSSAANGGRNLQAASYVCPSLTEQLGTDYDCSCDATSPTSLTLSCTTPDAPKCEPIPTDGAPGSEGSNIYEGEVCAAGSFEMNISGTTIADVINSPDVTFEGCYEYTESAQDDLAGREVCYNYVQGSDDGFSCDATLNDLPCTCSECTDAEGTLGLQLSCNNLVPDLAGTCRALVQENLGKVPRFDATQEDTVASPEPVEKPIDNSTMPEGVISNETTIIFPSFPGLEGIDGIDEEAIEIAERCIASGGTVTARDCCTTSDNFPSTCQIGACGCAPDASKPVAVCLCPTNTCFDARPSVGICIPGDAGSTIGEEDEDRDEEENDEEEVPSTLPESNATQTEAGNMTIPEQEGTDKEIDMSNATKAEICLMTGGNITISLLCIGSDAFPGTCDSMMTDPTLSPTLMPSNMSDTNMTDTNMTESNTTDSDMNMTSDVAEPVAEGASPPSSTTDGVSTILPVTTKPTAMVTAAPTMTAPDNRKLQIGAFGCALEELEEKEVCECPPGTCFDPEMGCIDPSMAMPDDETAEPTAQPTDAPTTYAPTTSEPTVAPTVVKETFPPTAEAVEEEGDTSSGTIAGLTMTAAALGALFVGIY